MRGNPFQISVLVHAAASQALFWALGSQLWGTPCPQERSSGLGLVFVFFFFFSSQQWSDGSTGFAEIRGKGCSCDIRGSEYASQTPLRAKDQEVSGGTGDSGRQNQCKGPEVECALRNSQKASVGRKKQS